MLGKNMNNVKLKCIGEIYLWFEEKITKLHLQLYNFIFVDTSVIILFFMCIFPVCPVSSTSGIFLQVPLLCKEHIREHASSNQCFPGPLLLGGDHVYMLVLL